MLLRLLNYVTGTLKDVVKMVTIPWNPDSESITVTTNSEAGSKEHVFVYLFDAGGGYTGGVFIGFYAQIQFYIGGCNTGNAPFSATLPTEIEKTWTFTYNYMDKRVVLHCNGVRVVNFVLSDSACDSSGWREKWERKPTLIEFASTDTASDSYCISSNTGNYKGCY